MIFAWAINRVFMAYRHYSHSRSSIQFTRARSSVPGPYGHSTIHHSITPSSSRCSATATTVPVSFAANQI
ncbi:MAG: hypothetical protein U5K35_10230 [Rhodohalobacter sp.]|nr:hypothetical protein [Rhodohalobacter sp.]